MGRPQLSARVLPYLRDLPQSATQIGPRPVAAPSNPVTAIFGPGLSRAAHAVDAVLGGSASVQRRLQRAGIERTVHDFRIEQVTWGLIGFGLAAAYGLFRELTGPPNPFGALVTCLLALVAGVLLRDYRLSCQVKARERKMVAEFPTIAELLALAVAAGESPVAALDRVVRRSGGEMSRELAGVLAGIRTGEPVAEAFDRLASRSGLPVVSRFAQAVAVAIERGTPLADVLHAQAADVREAGRRELIESAARREVFMMVPVVFLVLPVTVLFAFWPGLASLSFTVT